MFEWVDRDVVIDVSINIVPIVILAYFVLLALLWTPWPDDLLAVVMTHAMMLVPVLCLAFVTYYAAKAVERDARAV